MYPLVRRKFHSISFSSVIIVTSNWEERWIKEFNYGFKLKYSTFLETQISSSLRNRSRDGKAILIREREVAKRVLARTLDIPSQVMMRVDKGNQKMKTLAQDEELKPRVKSRGQTQTWWPLKPWPSLTFSYCQAIGTFAAFLCFLGSCITSRMR